MQVEITDILVEIGARGRLYAEAATTERDFVEIKLQDLLLGQHAFDARGKDHFLQLAGHRIFVAQQQVLGDLLGNGRTADRTFARSEFGGVIDHRIGSAGYIDTAMAEEGLVFGRKIGLDEALREIHILQLHPAFAGIGMDDLAIDAAHHGG